MSVTRGRLRLGVAVLVAILALAGVTLASAHSSLDTRISVKHSGKCLDHGNTAAAGAQIYQYTCLSSQPLHQRWRMSHIDSNWHQITSKLTGYCMDVYNWSTADLAPIVQWPCHGGANQQWQIGYFGDGYWYLLNRHSGKCADIEYYGGTPANFDRLIQFSCHGGNNQRFLIWNYYW